MPARPRRRAAATLILGWIACVSLADAAPDEAAWEALMATAARAESDGRLDDAEHALRRALAEAERDAGADLLRAQSLEALADLYRRAGRHADAEPLYLRSIALWENLLGPGQPRVGIPLHNLAVLYLESCRVDEAVPRIRRVVDLWEDTLGADHPDRLAAIVTEATLLRRCGRESEAVELESRLPAETDG